MRLRIRGPSGQSTVTLADDAKISDLQAKIVEATSIANFDIKYGYPPQSLSLEGYSPEATISELQLKLHGEQLIVSDKLPPEAPKPTQSSSSTSTATDHPQKKSAAPSSLPGKMSSNDPPELAMPSHASTMVLRVMPDDNSCMFRAFNSAFFGLMDNMTELRSVIAQAIQADADKYSAVVLEREPDDYCRWIQLEDSWGGFIELDILSRHFDIEISSIDIQTLRVDRYNEGRPTRCIIAYSGLHYDVIALSPSDEPYDKAYAPPDFDQKVFDTSDKEVMELAVDLCKILQQQRYFTDTATYNLRCDVCGFLCNGQGEANEHATQTGHSSFGEFS